ncbi:hypothetical protein HN51_057899 [Arachis hypogaea]
MSTRVTTAALHQTIVAVVPKGRHASTRARPPRVVLGGRSESRKPQVSSEPTALRIQPRHVESPRWVAASCTRPDSQMCHMQQTKRLHGDYGTVLLTLWSNGLPALTFP